MRLASSILKQLAKKIEQYQHKYQQEFQTLSHQEFACAADTMNAANQLAKTMKWHQLSAVDIVEKAHHDKAGTPKQAELGRGGFRRMTHTQAEAVHTRISDRVTGTVIALDSEIAAQRVRCGRFILARNVLDSSQLSADDAVREYKAQQGVERGFGFL